MPKLIVVPTPIGNLEDITLRAIKVLQNADFILAEDTRHTKKLLHHLGINKPLFSHHSHNEHTFLESTINKINAATGDVALVSDAGTPAISDPGFLLIRACLKKNIEVDCLPGATAFVPALVNSGLPCDRFLFEGFLPHKKGKQTKISALAESEITTILYESPYRLVKTLAMLKEVCDKNRKASVSRELTKVFQETKTGTLAELEIYFSQKQPKGEIVIILDGKK